MKSLYASTNIIRVIKRTHRRSRHRWILREIEWEYLDWIHPAQEGDWWWAPVYAIMKH